MKTESFDTYMGSDYQTYMGETLQNSLSVDEIRNTIISYYHTIHKREPDEPGLRWLVDKVINNVYTLEQIRDLFLTSEEYRELTRIESEPYPPDKILENTPEYFWYKNIFGLTYGRTFFGDWIIKMLSYNSILPPVFGTGADIAALKEYAQNRRAAGWNDKQITNIYNRWLTRIKTGYPEVVMTQNYVNKLAAEIDSYTARLKAHGVRSPDYDYDAEYEVLKIERTLKLPEWRNVHNKNKKAFLDGKIIEAKKVVFAYYNAINEEERKKIEEEKKRRYSPLTNQKLVIAAILSCITIGYVVPLLVEEGKKILAPRDVSEAEPKPMEAQEVPPADKPVVTTPVTATPDTEPAYDVIRETTSYVASQWVKANPVTTPPKDPLYSMPEAVPAEMPEAIPKNKVITAGIAELKKLLPYAGALLLLGLVVSAVKQRS